MKITNTQSGESYHLDPDTELEIERTNLFFNDYGEQSLPVTLPDTDRNRKLCGYAHLPANRQKQDRDIEVSISEGSFFTIAKQVILGAKERDGIDTTFYLNEGAFLSRISNTNLKDVFKDEYIPGIESVEQALDWMEGLCDNNNGEYACTTVLIDDGSNYQDESGRTYRLVILNERNSEGKLVARNSRMLYRPDDETYTSVGVGYYVTPFIRTNYLLKRVFAYFGYTLLDHFFSQTDPFRNMVMANTTADAIVNGRILIADLLPDITCGDLLEVFRKRFLCEFTPDEANRTVSILLFKDAIAKTAITIHGTQVADGPEVEYPETYKSITLNCSAVETPSDLPLLDNTEAVVSKYPYAIIQPDGSFRRKFVEYSQPIVYHLGQIQWSGRLPAGHRINESIASASATPYGIDLDLEQEEITIPDTLAEHMDRITGEVSYNETDTGMYIGPARWLNSRLLDPGETLEMEDEGNVKPVDDGSMPVVLLFTTVIDGRGEPSTVASIYTDEYSLAMNGENGIYEKFYRDYDNLLRNSLHTVRYQLMFDESMKMNTDVHGPVCIGGNKFLWNIMRYTVGGTSGPTECELLTTQLYEPIDSAKTISDLIPISTEYEWKAYSEVSVISEAEYQSATSKDLNLVKVYIDIPPSKELYDSKKQMYYREWAVKKEGRIDDYLLVKHWLQVGLIGTRP